MFSSVVSDNVQYHPKLCENARTIIQTTIYDPDSVHLSHSTGTKEAKAKAPFRLANLLQNSLSSFLLRPLLQDGKGFLAKYGVPKMKTQKSCKYKQGINLQSFESILLVSFLCFHDSTLKSVIL